MSGDLIVLLILCCCCICISISLGGFIEYKNCDNASGTKTDCFCGFDYCSASDVCVNDECKDPNASNVDPNASNVDPNGDEEEEEEEDPSPPHQSPAFVPGINACYPDGDSANYLLCGSSEVKFSNNGYNTGYCFPDLSNDEGRSCQCTAGWSKSSSSEVCDKLDINWNMFENSNGILESLSDITPNNKKVYMSPDEHTDNQLANELAGFHCPDNTYLDTTSYFDSSGESGQVCKKCGLLSDYYNTFSPSTTSEIKDRYNKVNRICKKSGQSEPFIGDVTSVANLGDAQTACHDDDNCAGFNYQVGLRYQKFSEEEITESQCSSAGSSNQYFLLKKKGFSKSGKNIGSNSCDASETLADYSGDPICSDVSAFISDGDGSVGYPASCMDTDTALTAYEISQLTAGNICANEAATCKDVLRYIDNDMYDGASDGNKPKLGRGRYKINATGKIECNLTNAIEKDVTQTIDGGGVVQTTVDENDISATNNFCLRNTTGIDHCNIDYGNGDGQGPCVNGTCTNGSNDDVTCTCSEGYIGQLCNIKVSDLCGDGNTLTSSEVTDIDPLLGKYYDVDTNRIKPNYNSTIYDVPIKTYSATPGKSPKLDDSKYDCNCASTEKKDRRGMNFFTGNMDKALFCNSPSNIQLDTIENTHDTIPGELATRTLFIDPSENQKPGIEKRNKQKHGSIGNMYNYFDCGSIPFTPGSSHADEDKGYQSGFYARVDSGEQPQCLPCYGETPRGQAHGNNVIDASKYLGWTFDSDYEAYEAIKNNINKKNIFTKGNTGPDSVHSIIDMFTDTGINLAHTCKPAYPDHYGTLGHYDRENIWTNEGHGNDLGGQNTDDTTTSRPVLSSWKPRQKFFINREVECEAGKEIAWAPEEFITVKRDNDSIGVDKCEIKTTIKPVRFSQPNDYQGWNRVISTNTTPNRECNVGNLGANVQCDEIIGLNENILWRHYESNRDRDLWNNDDIETAHSNVKTARNNTIEGVRGFDANTIYELAATTESDETKIEDNGNILTGTWPPGEGAGFDTSYGRDKIGYNEAATVCVPGNSQGDRFVGGCGGRAAAGAYWKEV